MEMVPLDVAADCRRIAAMSIQDVSSAAPLDGPSPSQARWLARGLRQPGGKLPLFDEDGQKVGETIIRSCIDRGWAEPWFANPIKPDWLVCKLTEAGRRAVEELRPAPCD